MADRCKCDVCDQTTANSSGYCDFCAVECIREGTINGSAQLFRLSQIARNKAHLDQARAGTKPVPESTIRTGNEMIDALIDFAGPAVKRGIERGLRDRLRKR